MLPGNRLSLVASRSAVWVGDQAPQKQMSDRRAPLASRGTATPWAIFLLVVDLWWRAFRQYRRAYGGKRRGLAWFIVVGGRGGFSGLHKLRYRMPGLGAEVLRRLGAIAVTLPGGEIVPALKSGAIDASEWADPWLDMATGLHKVARYYYLHKVARYY
jgi:hypothetical protein